MQAQTGVEDDEEVGETSPLNVRADGGKFMEEFFDQVRDHFSTSNNKYFVFMLCTVC